MWTDNLWKTGFGPKFPSKHRKMLLVAVGQNYPIFGKHHSCCVSVLQILPNNWPKWVKELTFWHFGAKFDTFWNLVRLSSSLIKLPYKSSVLNMIPIVDNFDPSITFLGQTLFFVFFHAHAALRIKSETTEMSSWQMYPFIGIYKVKGSFIDVKAK